MFLALAAVLLLQDPALEKECTELALAVQKEMAAGSADALNGAIDADAMIERISRNVDAPDAFKKAFVRSAASSLKFGQQVLTAMEGGGTYSFLRLKTDGGATRALFRLLPAAGGLNYHELVIERRDGKLRIVDILIYITGDLLTDTVRRMYVKGAAEVNKGLLDKLGGSDQLLVKYGHLLEKMGAQVREGKPKEALTSWGLMPEELQKEKLVMTLRVMAAGQIDDEEVYLRAIDAFQKAYPRDTAVDLIAFDGYFLRKKWEETFKTVDRLDQRLGGDPFLEVLRGNVWGAQEKWDNALECFLRGAKAEPSLVVAHWSVAGAALKVKNWKEVSRTLLILERDLKIEMTDLTEAEDYAEFIKTPEYREWMKARLKK